MLISSNSTRRNLSKPGAALWTGHRLPANFGALISETASDLLVDVTVASGILKRTDYTQPWGLASATWYGVGFSARLAGTLSASSRTDSMGVMRKMHGGCSEPYPFETSATSREVTLLIQIGADLFWRYAPGQNRDSQNMLPAAIEA